MPRGRWHGQATFPWLAVLTRGGMGGGAAPSRRYWPGAVRAGVLASGRQHCLQGMRYGQAVLPLRRYWPGAVLTRGRYGQAALPPGPAGSAAPMGGGTST